MPRVKKLHEAKTQGLNNFAHIASTFPSIKAATENENATEKPT